MANVLELVTFKATKRNNDGDEKQDSPRKDKRAAHEIRQEMMESRFGHLVQMSRKDGFVHPHMTAWRKIEGHGLTFTDTGCIIPAKQFWPGCGHRHTKLASLVSAQVFNNVKAEDLDKSQLKDELGWPCTPQLSHLCHTSVCCNPKHVVVEPQWRNLKRNYCGREGQCDCGVQPNCLARYRASNVAFTVSCLNQDAPDLKKTLVSMMPEHVDIKILPRDALRKEDKKAENRKRRRTATRHHNAQRRRKQQKAAGGVQGEEAKD